MLTSINNYLTFAITAIVICFGFFYIYAKYKLSYWSKRGVKTPPTHFMFGNFKDIITFKKSPGQLLGEIHNWADPDDPYIGFYIFHKPMLLLRDRELIKKIMIRDFDIFPNRRFGSCKEKDFVGFSNLLCVKQPKWKYLRGKLTPPLTGQKLKMLIPLITECGNSMLNYIDKAPKDENGCKKFELKEMSSRYITDIIASLAFGISTNSFEGNNNEFWEIGRDMFTDGKWNIVLLIHFLFPQLSIITEPFVKRPARIFREIFWQSAKIREKTGNMRGDLMDFLLALKNEEQNPIFKFEGDNLVGQAVSFYLAGIEATATAIAFAIMELARHPEYQESLYEEIHTTISGKELTLELINDMPFMKSVVNEVLRLYPPLPITDRTAVSDYKIPSTELVIEKNISVYMSVNGVSHDPTYFSNPQHFMPLRNDIEDKKFYESLPFGIGPRACIGQRMGLITMKIALIAILSNYVISYETQNDVNNAPAMFTYIADGINVLFKKRDK